MWNTNIKTVTIQERKKIQHTQNVFSTVNGFIFIKLNQKEKKNQIKINEKKLCSLKLLK